MDIKDLNEALKPYISEAKVTGRRDIDFENVGCGFSVEYATTVDNRIAFALDGFSNNSATDCVFVSNDFLVKGTPEEREALNDKVVETRQQIEQELLTLANDFDSSVLEIMNKYGFTKE